eukprot:m.205915 g.205915  ORF g.205915 m.205915 type:complete len:238 (+) comp15420_c0_seq1:76-789(+)
MQELLCGVAGSVMLYAGLAYEKPMLAITGAGLHLYTLLAANKGEGKPEPPAQATTKPSPPPEPTPAPPPKPTVVVAFDFDKCLMTSHWFGKYRYQPLDGINPGPEDFALSNPTAVFTQLLSQPHVRVAVASFGRKDVITKAIYSMLPPDLAEQVYVTTPGDFPGTRDGTGLRDKNRQLGLVADRFDVPLEQIQFFDDDRKNIAAAVQIGVKAVWTAPFDDSHLPKISEHIGVEVLQN